MPLSPLRLEREIAKCLEQFYAKRLNGLTKLSLKKILGKKNPYLYRALGIENASEIVEQIMAAFVTSSDETILGNVFSSQSPGWQPVAEFLRARV